MNLDKKVYVKKHKRKKNGKIENVRSHTRNLASKYRRKLIKKIGIEEYMDRRREGGSRLRERLDYKPIGDQDEDFIMWLQDALTEKNFEEYSGKYADEIFADGWTIDGFVNKVKYEEELDNGETREKTFRLFKLVKDDNEIIIPVPYDKRGMSGHDIYFSNMRDSIDNVLRLQLGMEPLEEVKHQMRERKLSSGKPVRSYDRGYFEKNKDRIEKMDNVDDKARKTGHILLSLDVLTNAYMQGVNERESGIIPGRKPHPDAKTPRFEKYGVEDVDEDDIIKVKVPDWIIDDKYSGTLEEPFGSVLDNKVIGRVENKTDKAYLVKSHYEIDGKHGSEETWIPKSMVEDVEVFTGFEEDDEDVYM